MKWAFACFFFYVLDFLLGFIIDAVVGVVLVAVVIVALVVTVAIVIIVVVILNDATLSRLFKDSRAPQHRPSHRILLGAWRVEQKHAIKIENKNS